MVSTRDSTFTGSTFRAAVLRLQGTLMGSMFSFFLLVLALGGKETLVRAMPRTPALARRQKHHKRLTPPSNAGASLFRGKPDAGGLRRPRPLLSFRLFRCGLARALLADHPCLQSPPAPDIPTA